MKAVGEECKDQVVDSIKQVQREGLDETQINALTPPIWKEVKDAIGQHPPPQRNGNTNPMSFSAAQTLSNIRKGASEFVPDFKSALVRFASKLTPPSTRQGSGHGSGPVNGMVPGFSPSPVLNGILMSWASHSLQIKQRTDIWQSDILPRGYVF
ncbi:MAG: hypothetical protein M1816_005576 [Peltula sp. TS41687]|nr:MAG: hypothetical protein M1816_005576 [Peltula sp. TS41687]